MKQKQMNIMSSVHEVKMMSDMLTALKKDRDYYVKVVQRIERSIERVEREIHDMAVENQDYA